MNIVILDLEWNGAYSRRLHGFINEIIEFGAVKLDAQLNITDRFSCFVKPQVTKKDQRDYLGPHQHYGCESFGRAPVHAGDEPLQKWAGDCVIATWGVGHSGAD